MHSTIMSFLSKIVSSQKEFTAQTSLFRLQIKLFVELRLYKEKKRFYESIQTKVQVLYNYSFCITMSIKHKNMREKIVK